VTAVRVAMWVIWGAYALLALAITLFVFALDERSDIGTVWGATVLLGMAGTTVCFALLGAGALGIYGMLGQAAARRPAGIITVLAGLSGGTFLGWMAMGFWGWNR
jgi:hypothetical protein